jgi:hypothetical protein
MISLQSHVDRFVRAGRRAVARGGGAAVRRRRVVRVETHGGELLSRVGERGLREGSSVALNGVRIGYVENLQLQGEQSQTSRWTCW